MYGHEVTVQSPSGPFQQYQRQGEAICVMAVPGIRENSPFVEEDDIIELRQLLYGDDGSLFGMNAWLAARNAVLGNSSIPTPRQILNLNQLGPAPGWTNVVYSARVLSVVKSKEQLVLRVLGLPGSVIERTERFNVQFMCPPERHLPSKSEDSTQQSTTTTPSPPLDWFWSADICRVLG